MGGAPRLALEKHARVGGTGVTMQGEKAFFLFGKGKSATSSLTGGPGSGLFPVPPGRPGLEPESHGIVQGPGSPGSD